MRTLHSLLFYLTFPLGAAFAGSSVPDQDQVTRGLLHFRFRSGRPVEEAKTSNLWTSHANLTRAEAERLRGVVWETYRDARRRLPDAQEDAKRRTVSFEPDALRYELKRRGSKPESGWPLTISLHGGGVESKAVNDEQWRSQQKRHRVPGLYVCPRAPRDSWNQWHDDYIYPLMDILLQRLVLFEEVDPDRVYLTGFSSGGYGAFALGSKMADRFAAVSAAAAGPAEGQCSPENWRNTPLLFQVGESDVAYGRVGLCREFERKLIALRQPDADGFPFQFVEHRGQGHEVSDKNAGDWMRQYVRQPRPRKVDWRLTDRFFRRFHWLGVDQPEPGHAVFASVANNTVTLRVEGARRLLVRLDDSLADLDRPVTIMANGTMVYQGKMPRSLKTLAETVEERGDPRLIFPAEMEVLIPRDEPAGRNASAAGGS